MVKTRVDEIKPESELNKVRRSDPMQPLKKMWPSNTLVLHQNMAIQHLYTPPMPYMHTNCKQLLLYLSMPIKSNFFKVVV